MTHKTIEFLVEKERAYEAFKKGLDYLAQISSIKLDQILGKFKLAISANKDAYEYIDNANPLSEKLGLIATFKGKDYLLMFQMIYVSKDKICQDLEMAIVCKGKIT